MAEFQVVAKELERMCNTYHAARGKCGTDECPLYYENFCYAKIMVHVRGEDACNLEKLVMSWAAEHPEPVFPTWKEWLLAAGYAKEIDDGFGCINTYFEWNAPMPSDIAQKLGIEPKEGV